MALGTNVHVRKVTHPRYKWVATFREAGKIRKRYFPTKKKAETWAAPKEEEALELGTLLSLTEEERNAIQDLRHELEAIGLPIRQALEFAIDHHHRLQNSVAVSQLIEEFKREKRDAGVSLRYVQDMRSRLGRFEKSFGTRTVATINSIEVEEWLRKLGLSAVSQNNFRRLLVGLFNSAKRRDYCEVNPAEQVPTAKVVADGVGILTPTEAETLLTKAAPAIRPVIALGLFAGIRMEELERLDWSNVDVAGNYITIPAEKAKTAKRRLIPIRDNLREWIEAAPVRTGSVWPSKGRDLLRKAKRASGFASPNSLTKTEKKADIEFTPWPNNALRHSFASYHLASFKNAHELALEMGHTDTKLIFQHYRELVRPEAAELYWAIRPEKDKGRKGA